MSNTLRFDLPAPDIAAWRTGNTGTEGVWHFDSGLPGRQVLVCAALLTGVGYLAGFSPPMAFIAGAGFVLTSTAVVLQVPATADRADLPPPPSPD